MGYGFSADNLVFGMGGALLQKIDRDTQKFAMKASAGYINGEWVDIYKDPVTDSGKKSKRGRQMLYQQVNGGSYITRTENARVNGRIDGIDFIEALETIWENGKLLIEENFTTIRNRTN
jgi:nicotinamide phosphoribosyltransferase